jgi:hypothetical protein
LRKLEKLKQKEMKKLAKKEKKNLQKHGDSGAEDEGDQRKDSRDERANDDDEEITSKKARKVGTKGLASKFGGGRGGKSGRLQRIDEEDEDEDDVSNNLRSTLPPLRIKTNLNTDEVTDEDENVEEEDLKLSPRQSVVAKKKPGRKKASESAAAPINETELSIDYLLIPPSNPNLFKFASSVTARVVAWENEQSRGQMSPEIEVKRPWSHHLQLFGPV